MGMSFDLDNGSRPPTAPSAIADEGGLTAAWRSELDTFRAQIARFPDEDPADILGTISGIAGRIAQIRADLLRINTPRCARLRTTEVDPMREDLDFQFRIWSRKVALMEWELRVSGGGI